MSFKSKTISLFLIFIAVTVFVFAGIGIWKGRSAVVEQIRNQFIGKGQDAKAAINKHSEALLHFSRQIIDSRLIEGMFIAYEGGFYGAGLASGKDVKAFTNSYQTLNKQFKDRATSLVHDFSFSELLLVTTSGQIVFSLEEKKEDHFYLGKNILNGVLKNSNLANCYDNAKKEPHKFSFTGIIQDPIRNKVSAYFCSTKFSEFDYLADGVKKGDVLGAVIIEVDLNVISDTVAWKMGAGETGASYIAKSDGSLVTEFRNKNKTIDLESSHEQNLNFLKNENSNLDELVEINDFFENKVFEYRSKVDFFGENWFLVIQKQTSEALKPVTELMYIFIVTSVILIILSMSLTYILLSQSIKPVIESVDVVTNNSVKISQNSTQLKDVSTQLSDEASRGASSIEETVASMNQISETVESNTSAVNRVLEISKTNSLSAKEGALRITELIETMNAVAAKAQEVNAITSVIEDIAFQTNLLSLNAAVEAARAGEQGKGFAVVADAVRSLAQKSAQSAKEISLLIGSTVDISLKGKSQADEGGNVLAAIVKSADEVVTLNDQVANASKEQAYAVNEVILAVKNLDEMTQKTAYLAQSVVESSIQLESAAVEMSNSAQELSTAMVGKS